MKQRLLANTALRPASPVAMQEKRKSHICRVTRSEIDELGDSPTWDDWKALFMSKNVPPMRLVDGADFRMTETPTAMLIEFP